MLRIGVEPQVGDAEIGPQQVAREDHRTAAEHPFGALALDADRGMEPRRQAVRGERVAIPPLDIGGRGFPRRDDRARESLRDQRMRDSHDPGVKRDLGGCARFEPAGRQLLARHDPLAVLGRERLLHHPVLAQRHAVAEG